MLHTPLWRADRAHTPLWRASLAHTPLWRATFAHTPLWRAICADTPLWRAESCTYAPVARGLCTYAFVACGSCTYASLARGFLAKKIPSLRNLAQATPSDSRRRPAPVLGVTCCRFPHFKCLHSHPEGNDTEVNEKQPQHNKGERKAK